YLEILNEYDGKLNGKANVFLGKIDLDNIGITGHSQGGIGVINAVTDQKHADVYKAAAILSCGNTDFSAAFQWTFDDTLINTPSLILGSTGNTDQQIAPLESLQKLYNNIPDGVTKIMARRKNADHGEMLYFGDGYVTAWFMYHLKNDAEAGAAFVGDNAEILSNIGWQDVEKNF
ncbi:MAG: alpha/beta hydrolase, partial [Lachnospiraceae bacterium]|nr:alpha/beta hydrolase [Ruminococcus sp.]MCM1276631.1 alpha/beta hydrolase [Lachnospiraceae bacterium]